MAVEEKRIAAFIEKEKGTEKRKDFSAGSEVATTELKKVASVNFLQRFYLRHKSRTSCSWRRPISIPWEKNSWKGFEKKRRRKR